MKTYLTFHPPVCLRKILGSSRSLTSSPWALRLHDGLNASRSLTKFRRTKGRGFSEPKNPFPVGWENPRCWLKTIVGSGSSGFLSPKTIYKTPQQWNTCVCSRWLFYFLLWDSSPLNHHLEVFYPTTLGKSKPVLNGWDNSIYRNYKVLVTHVLSAMYRGPITPCRNDRLGAHFYKGSGVLPSYVGSFFCHEERSLL